MSLRSHWAALGPTTLFVLLWGSGGIFSKLALNSASVFLVLSLRFAVALLALLSMRLFGRHLLPDAGTNRRVAVTGLVLIGGYSSFYFLALSHGVTPGTLATILGAQPILTLVFFEKHFSIPRLSGVGLAFGGLVLTVFQTMSLSNASSWGIAFALLALAGATIGGILQKRVKQAPERVLPLQLGVSALLCLVLLPVQATTIQFSWHFVIALLWLGIVISVAAQLLLYRLINAGNLVNVTSLFYLVPVVTALMDYLFFGNRLPIGTIVGMGAILTGLTLVFGRFGGIAREPSS